MPSIARVYLKPRTSTLQLAPFPLEGFPIFKDCKFYAFYALQAARNDDKATSGTVHRNLGILIE